MQCGVHPSPWMILLSRYKNQASIYVIGAERVLNCHVNDAAVVRYRIAELQNLGTWLFQWKMISLFYSKLCFIQHECGNLWCKSINP